MKLIDTKLYALLMNLWRESARLANHDQADDRAFLDAVEALERYEQDQQAKSHLSS
jgi:hypothetical protein